MLKKDVRDWTLEDREFRNSFRNIINHRLRVPEGYDHDSCLKDFWAKYRQDFRFGPLHDLTDENFSKVAVRLQPEQRVYFSIYEPVRPVTPWECWEFYRLEKGVSPDTVFLGAQGLALVWQQALGALIADGHCYLSFDEKCALEGLGIPFMRVWGGDAENEGGWRFDLKPIDAKLETVYIYRRRQPVVNRLLVFRVDQQQIRSKDELT